MHRRSRLLLLLITGLLLVAELRAQPIWFGAADNPREYLQEHWWRMERGAELSAGLSLIGAQWRSVASASAYTASRTFTARVEGTLRPRPGGSYKPDFDEPYDALRLIDYARWTPAGEHRGYVRIGTIEDMTLGHGHLINKYSSSVAWDERTIGAQTAWQNRYLLIGGFADNVLLNGITAASLSLNPFGGVRNERMRSLRFSGTVATDLGIRPLKQYKPLNAYNVEASMQAVSSGAITLNPFVSAAWYEGYGSGMGFGADLEATHILDVARFRLRMGLFYNGENFIPGYIGSFYRVTNQRARILVTEGYNAGQPDAYVGTTLDNALGGEDLLTDLRLLVFQRFEFSYQFKRHYGSQALSEYHLNLFARTSNDVSLDIGMDRGGLRGFFSLFNDLGDQTALRFDLRYGPVGPVHTRIGARYSFERIGDAPDGTNRYLVQRRLEPQIALKFDL